MKCLKSNGMRFLYGMVCGVKLTVSSQIVCYCLWSWSRRSVQVRFRGENAATLSLRNKPINYTLKPSTIFP
jgi:hypothetical protein